MRVVLLDGERLTDAKDVFDAFVNALGLPEDTGRNLDALHDALGDIAEPVGVIVVDPEGLEAALGRRFKGFMRLMADLEEELDGFRFCPDPFG